ncbi:hypothetical protein Ccrd_022926 [Cynara cardunculus var. scolymus]|uniref:Uncharacterized protein n=1 Tax=Cynara cardunculus var. scolymus TaxID=59895 RepID=A0A124SE37_CYNCS|nr:hypothetical protein Ccrd_022926 [Cynara cardunculus var. scolymus]
MDELSPSRYQTWKLHRSRGEDDHPSASPSWQQMSKGQWERRLQTDIHMAKQALCDALSLDNKSVNLPQLSSSTFSRKPSSSIGTNPSAKIEQELVLPPPQTNQSTITYASSTENIARLLPNWMKKKQKSSQTSSESTQTRNSFDGQFPSPPSEGFDNSLQFGLHNYSNISEVSQSVSPETSLFQDESNPSANTDNAQLPPLSFLEKWLLDDANAQEHDQDNLMNLSLEESNGLF